MYDKPFMSPINIGQWLTNDCKLTALVHSELSLLTQNEVVSERLVLLLKNVLPW